MKQGSQCGSLAILSEADLQRIHEAGLALLENPGVLCESDRFWAFSKKRGLRSIATRVSSAFRQGWLNWRSKPAQSRL